MTGGAPWGPQGVGLAQAAGETIPAPEPDKAGRGGGESFAPALPGAAAPLMGGPAASGIGASTGLTPEAAGTFLPQE